VIAPSAFGNWPMSNHATSAARRAVHGFSPGAKNIT
jgi:hypothetical protein